MSDCLYEERVASARTEMVFVGLALLFLTVSGLRVASAGVGWVAAALFAVSCMFVFYAVNYRTLTVRITGDALHLRFGLFSWHVPLDAIARWHQDDISLWRVGGAGIHFTVIRGRYRVFLNFLEHSRVVLELATPRGLVRDVVFSTRRLPEVCQALALAKARLQHNLSVTTGPGRSETP